MTVLILLLLAGSAARITRFITADFLAADFRVWMARRFGGESKVAYLVECPWCAGIWVNLAVFAAGWVKTGLGWWLMVPTAFTASWLYGLAAQNWDSDE